MNNQMMMSIPYSHIVSLIMSGGMIMLGIVHVLLYFSVSKKASHILGCLTHLSMAYLMICAGEYSIMGAGIALHTGHFAERRLAFLATMVFFVSVELLYASMAKFRKPKKPLLLVVVSLFCIIFLLSLMYDSDSAQTLLRRSFYCSNFVLLIYCFVTILNSLRKGDKQSRRLLIFYIIYISFVIGVLPSDFHPHPQSWLQFIVAFFFLFLMDVDMIIRFRIDVTSSSAKIKEMSSNFTQQIDNLRTSNESKDKFLSIVAHDLKNPISSLKILSDIYTEDAKNSGDLHSIEMAQMMSDSISSVYRLLDNLLTWARSQNGSIIFKPEMIAIESLVDSLHDAADIVCSQKNIKMNIVNRGAPDILADSNMMQTILRNLVTNAVKFSFPGSTIDVNFDSDGDYSFIQVSDSGVGMSQESIDRLFRIEKVTSTHGTNNERGTGLGLLICYEFVQKHGGTISVYSDEGLGTTFAIMLPRNEKTESDIPSPSAKKNEK